VVVVAIVAATSVLVTSYAPAVAARVSSASWHITVYYTAVESTAVESYHPSPSQEVRGCLDLDCSMRENQLIGVYPSDFNQAVMDEGTWGITSGNNAGKYLNWSYDVGYWLDTASRDSYGGALKPYVSSAADPRLLPRGTKFKVLSCGGDTDTGEPPDPTVCKSFKQANWVISDEFTPGLGGRKHLDLYIGEEDQEDFTDTSPKYIDLSKVSIQRL